MSLEIDGNFDQLITNGNEAHDSMQDYMHEMKDLNTQLKISNSMMYSLLDEICKQHLSFLSHLNQFEPQHQTIEAATNSIELHVWTINRILALQDKIKVIPVGNETGNME